LEEQKKQIAKLRDEKKRLLSERVDSQHQSGGDSGEEEETIAQLVQAKEDLSKWLPDSPAVKSLERRIEEARRKRDQ